MKGREERKAGRLGRWQVGRRQEGRTKRREREGGKDREKKRIFQN